MTARDNASVSCSSVWATGKSAASATVDNTDCAIGNRDLKVVSRCSACDRRGDTCDGCEHGDGLADTCVNGKFCSVDGVNGKIRFMGDDNGVNKLSCPCVDDFDDGAAPSSCDCEFKERKAEIEH